VLFFTILAALIIIIILWTKLKPANWRIEGFSFNRSSSTNKPSKKSVIRCQICRTSWIHPENRLSGGINWLGEDSIRWRCPSCGHVVVWERPLQFPHSNYGPNEDIGSLHRVLPEEYEG
jgi:DNA-directed RNA polymerase subunit RPC12/RpoP